MKPHERAQAAVEAAKRAQRRAAAAVLRAEKTGSEEHIADARDRLAEAEAFASAAMLAAQGAGHDVSPERQERAASRAWDAAEGAKGSSDDAEESAIEAESERIQEDFEEGKAMTKEQRVKWREENGLPAYWPVGGVSDD